jgi:hypothetical protein
MAEVKNKISAAFGKDVFINDPTTTNFFDDLEGSQVPEVDIFAASSIGAEAKVKELLET